MIFWQCIFWFSLLLIFHSYVLFPGILYLLSRNKNPNQDFYSEDELPSVSILIAAYNEEAVIGQKIESVLNTGYPKDKLSIYIGSDNSSDNTNTILEEFEKKYPLIHCIYFKERTGKPGIINHLVNLTGDDILIMTDANIMFVEDTIYKLVRHFKNPAVGIVGGNTLNDEVSKDGVSIQEKIFTSREIKIKYREGLIWNATIGVYGGIYAIRKEVYTPVPKGFAVDDFFISMCVLRQKRSVIMDVDAITFEDLPNLISEEYRRKVRIATGNFRNMRYFLPELLTPWKGSSFAYISHKIIRWLGPFLIILFMLSNIFLWNSHEFYHFTGYALLAGFTLPIIDFFLSKLGIHVVFLRFVRHFITMNIAMLHGFMNYIGGITRDVWQPTNR